MDVVTLTKRPYFKLESESSSPSNEDTESVYSVQDKDTDSVHDTSDTDFDIEIEYEVESLSGNEANSLVNSSEDSEEERNIVLAAAAAALCDNSFEKWVTDGEDSDNSSMEDYSFNRTDFWTCIKCKSMKKDPLYRFCDKCFQDRKTFFPPRPKPKRKRADVPVKLDTLRSCLSGLSHDSGIGSSQECPPLGLEKIVIPSHLAGTESLPLSPVSEEDVILTKPKETGDTTKPSLLQINRKRQLSESSLSDCDIEIKRPRRREKSKSPVKEIISEKLEPISTELDAPNKDQCIFCNVSPKNAIFLHGNIAHMCCCYKCAIRTWRTIKRCPICNRKVSNVVKVFKN